MPVEGEKADAFVQSRRSGQLRGQGCCPVGLPRLAGLDGAPGSGRQVGGRLKPLLLTWGGAYYCP